ncbi:hypothetical protein Y592_07530 [Thermosipho sp. 1070]|nr:hypothetical protein Y592_07530 [Thermosipho sp. 1070]
MADAHDSGSCGFSRAGSNPALGTSPGFPGFFVFEKIERWKMWK